MLERNYVQNFNHCYQRSCNLWEARYKATLKDSESFLLTSIRYIELPPVRIEMLETPADYPWSNYHKNALKKIQKSNLLSCVTKWENRLPAIA